MLMTELSPVLLAGIERFHRLSREKETLNVKLEKCRDVFRQIVYRRLIGNIERSLQLLVPSLLDTDLS
jgi:hypothetical protein